MERSPAFLPWAGAGPRKAGPPEPQGNIWPLTGYSRACGLCSGGGGTWKWGARVSVLACHVRLSWMFIGSRG